MSDNLSPFSPAQTSALTKGQRTAAKILDVAEGLFAERGFAGTSLRQIAEGVGIREPGLYNHFAGKQELYEEVLKRALAPLTAAVSVRLDEATGLPDYTELPSLITDLLLERPQRAALLQQAMSGGGDGPGATKRYRAWLEDIFERGVGGIHELGLSRDIDRQSLVLNLLAVLNLTIGYVQSREQFRLLAKGEITDPDNVTRQKMLLRKVIRAMLIS